MLVGMMGAGKTSVGLRLARLLGVTFTDTDVLVEETAERTVAEVFADEGERAFREREAAAVALAMAYHQPFVISVGGGAVTWPATRELLLDARAVVWLRATPATLAERVAHDPTVRPLLRDGDPAATLARLAAERAPHYEALADAVVDVDGLGADEVAQRVVEAL